MTEPRQRQRLRFRYAKDEVLMYISHRDLLRFVFRQFRRIRLPHAYSEGFSPKPKVSFGPALSLGVRADNELLDIEMQDGINWGAAELAENLARLRENSEPRRFAMELAVLPEDAANISKAVKQCRYSLRFEGAEADVAAVMASAELPFTNHKGRNSDQKLAVLGWEQAEGRLEIHADNSERVLNVLSLVKIITERTGQRCTDMLRRSLLDGEGREL
ncbi:MAG: TIGR03936 family radical SAM-associated protein [bacterium]